MPGILTLALSLSGTLITKLGQLLLSWRPWLRLIRQLGLSSLQCTHKHLGHGGHQRRDLYVHRLASQSSGIQRLL